MAEFFNFEADDEDLYNECERYEKESEYDDEHDREFIDDRQYDESVSDYYTLENVSRPYEEGMEDALENFDYSQEPENYCEEPICAAFNNFDNFQSRIVKFKLSLHNPQELENPDSVFYSILYALRHRLTDKTDTCINDDMLSSDVKPEIFDAFNQIKDNLRLDLDLVNFENQCFQVNTILMKNNLCLRVYKLKDKFRFLIKQDSNKKGAFRELSSCIIEKFNSFNIVQLEFYKKLERELSPIDILYEPAKSNKENLDCFFTTEINLAYRTSFSEDEKIRHGTAFQCFFGSKYFGRKNI